MTGVETRRERTSGREKRAAESEGKKAVANFRPSRTTIVPDGGTADYSQGIFQLSKSLRRFLFLKRRIRKYDSNIYSILATKWLIIVPVFLIVNAILFIVVCATQLLVMHSLLHFLPLN